MNGIGRGILAAPKLISEGEFFAEGDWLESGHQRQQIEVEGNNIAAALRPETILRHSEDITKADIINLDIQKKKFYVVPNESKNIKKRKLHVSENIEMVSLVAENSFHQLSGRENMDDISSVHQENPESNNELEQANPENNTVSEHATPGINLNNLNYNNINIPNLENNSVSEQKVDWLRPIFVHGASSKTVLEIVRKASVNAKVKIHNTGFGKFRLFLDDAFLHTKMMNCFREAKIDAFSFTPKAYKKESFLLKGIMGDFTSDEVRLAILEELPNIKIFKVSPFSTAYSRQNKIALNIFVVQLDVGQDPKNLFKIKGLINQRVKWEKITRSGAVQCYRCQRFGHMSQNCAYQRRCVKCDTSHEIGACPRENVGNNPPKPLCVNCGEEGHPSNYRECRVYQAYISRRENNKKLLRDRLQNNSTFVSRAINNYVQPGKSYAATSKGLNNSIPQEKTNFFKDYIEFSNKLFGVSLATLVGKLRSFWPKFLKMNNDEQFQAYLEFTASFISNP